MTSSRGLVVGVLFALLGCSNEVIEPPPAAPDRLEFRAPPVQAVAGVPFEPAVQIVIRRLDGTIDAASAVDVSITSRSSTVIDTLRGVVTVTAIAGIATFPAVALTRVSADTRLFARAVGLTGAESSPIRVVHGEGTQLVFLTQPSGAVAGQPLPALRIQLRDAVGNHVTSGSGPVTIAIATGPPGASITGTGSADMIAGEASLNDVRLPRAGTGYTLLVSLVGNAAVRSPVTRVFSTAPAAPAELIFLAEPTASVVGIPITPAVRISILDGFGNTVTEALRPITLGLAVAPTGTQLLGSTTMTPSAGVATFSDLRVDRPGATVRLRATSPGLNPAVSAIFGVVAP